MSVLLYHIAMKSLQRYDVLFYWAILLRHFVIAHVLFMTYINQCPLQAFSFNYCQSIQNNSHFRPIFASFIGNLGRYIKKNYIFVPKKRQKREIAELEAHGERRDAG